MGEPSTTRAADTRSVGTKHATARRVLIVEDDPTSKILMSELTRNYGVSEVVCKLESPTEAARSDGSGKAP